MYYKGLTDNQVKESREKNGSNALSKAEQESIWSKLLEGFKDKMIIILLVALAINIVFVIMGQAEWYEAVGIAVAVLIANFVSVLSEHKNESKFQELQDEASRTKCKVFRNGALTEIYIDEIVVGDYVKLESGDKVPADGILVEGEIKVEQSALNGETKEATKRVLGENQLGDTKDLLNEFYLFRGTVVCNGECIMEVSTVGDNTIYGELAKEMQEETRESPLKVKLGKLADIIAKIGYTGGILIALAYLFQNIFIDTGFDMNQISQIVTNIPLLLNLIVDSVILAVIIIVVAVPEGLPMMIALVLAMNMGKMMKDNVLVRKINGIETAGGLNILFSDKTGTITEGKLSVSEIIDGDINKYSNMQEMSACFADNLIIGIGMNNSSSISNETVIGGNNTDRCLMKYLLDNKAYENIDRESIVEFISFDSVKKYSTVITNTNMKTQKYIKGAPEKIVEICDTYIDKDGNEKPLDKEKINKYMDEQAGKAMRLIAVAVTDEIEKEETSAKMKLIAILSIRDNVRKEAVEAIKEVQNAGVQVVMVTGDRKETAVAIATEAGLLKEKEDLVFTSKELAELTDEELKEKIRKIKVVARALPTDKSRLVKIAQELDLVVGMTGDGVNDAPALKKADVGFAMGSGTDVAKEAGDIVIMDDNFLSIEKAILYGRTIFKSIRKFIVFQLTVNVAAVLLSFIGPLIGVHEPLTIIQMLWVNLIMDTLAAIAFGGEAPLRRYMREKPISRKESIVTKNMLIEIGLIGVYICVISLMLVLNSNLNSLFENTHNYIETVVFAFFIFATIFNGFNARTESMNLFENIAKNKRFLTVMGLVALIQVIMVYVGGELLRTVPISLKSWIIVAILAILVIPIDLIRKLLTKNKSI